VIVSIIETAEAEEEILFSVADQHNQTQPIISTEEVLLIPYGIWNTSINGYTVPFTFYCCRNFLICNLYFLGLCFDLFHFVTLKDLIIRNKFDICVIASGYEITVV